MRYPNNWQYKTIEILENDVWEEPKDFPSRLVRTCFSLRRKSLNEFTVEDMRIMIGQQIGLTYLVPLAIEALKSDLFAEGDFYPGDLLKSVLTVGAEFWKANIKLWEAVNDLVKDQRERLEEEDISIEEFDAAIN